MQRRNLLKLTSIMATLLTPLRGVLAQSSFPERAIRIIVQFPPGTTPDLLARIAAEHLQQRFNQPVIVENRPGAAGNIAADFVAKSPPDGYTLLMGQNGLAWAPWLFPKLSFDPLALAPVSIVANVPFVVTVRKDLPVHNVKELVRYAQDNPGKLSCGTSGIGSPQHLLAELFMHKTGTKLLTVPYKGATLIYPDLIDGRLDLLFSAAEGVLPFIQAGKIRALAVADNRRVTALPDLETMAESGFALDVGFWVGLFAPPGTPLAISRRIADELRSIRTNDVTIQRVSTAGTEMRLSSPEEMAKEMRIDYERWGVVIKAKGIKLD